MIDQLRRDVKLSLRTLFSAPGFTLAAVFTLALGIGASAAIFTVVNAVLLKPLHYSDPSRIVSVSMVWRGTPGSHLSFPDYHDLHD